MIQQRSWTTGQEADELLDLIAAALHSRPDWWAEAKCKGETATFFAEGRTSATAESIKAARQICAGCPVASECLESGLAEAYGVWAGRSIRERQRIRRQRRKQEDQGTAA